MNLIELSFELLKIFLTQSIYYLIVKVDQNLEYIEKENLEYYKIRS
jgi:hypothetical protein